MDIETMPHAMYSSSNTNTVIKINHVPYQIIHYDDKVPSSVDTQYSQTSFY